MKSKTKCRRTARRFLSFLLILAMMDPSWHPWSYSIPMLRRMKPDLEAAVDFPQTPEESVIYDSDWRETVSAGCGFTEREPEPPRLKKP